MDDSLSPIKVATFDINPKQHQSSIEKVREDLITFHEIVPADIEDIYVVMDEHSHQNHTHLIAAVKIAGKFMSYHRNGEALSTLVESARPHSDEIPTTAGHVDISGLDKAELLAALYNAAKPLGMGAMHYSPIPMSHNLAQLMIEDGLRFDYVKGRPLKVNLSKDSMFTGLYDRDQGEGLAAAIVAELRRKKSILSEVK